MTSRLENEINGFRDKIEKQLSSSLSSESTNNEEITDILNVLIKIKITMEVLRNTRIGATIQEVKKRFSGHEIGVFSKRLLSKWKKDCENTTEVKKPPPSDSKIAGVNKEEDEFNDDSHYEMLSTIRKHVRQQ